MPGDLTSENVARFPNASRMPTLTDEIDTEIHAFVQELRAEYGIKTETSRQIKTRIRSLTEQILIRLAAGFEDGLLTQVALLTLENQRLRERENAKHPQSG